VWTISVVEGAKERACWLRRQAQGAHCGKASAADGVQPALSVTLDDPPLPASSYARLIKADDGAPAVLVAQRGNTAAVARASGPFYREGLDRRSCGRYDGESRP